MGDAMTLSESSADRARLRADCERCVALCCVAPTFGASADFAVDKPAGVACTNLQTDNRCSIHAQLRARGFPGCTAYDCFGAGQQLTQITFAGRSWRDDPRTAAEVFITFEVMRDLHEILWYLTEAATLAPARGTVDRIAALRYEVDGLTAGTAATLQEVDVDALRTRAGALLLQVSEQHRGPTPSGLDFTRADLIGRSLKGRRLRGASFVGAMLIAADLTGADLRGADLRSADLRGANLAGADLTDTLFLIQSQLAAARGDAATRLPATLDRPSHWLRPTTQSGRLGT